MKLVWRMAGIAVCALTWAALLWCGLRLFASVWYALNLPELYAVYEYAPDRMDDLKCKAVIWLAISAFWFLLAGAVCGAVTYRLWRKRKASTGQTPDEER